MARLVDWLARSPGRSFIIIFLLAFAIRGFFLTKVPHRHIVPHTRWEMEATAFSLAERGEFADPYIYYVVAYMGRYRVPLDWILLVFAGAAVWGWIDRG